MIYYVLIFLVLANVAGNSEFWCARGNKGLDFSRTLCDISGRNSHFGQRLFFVGQKAYLAQFLPWEKKEKEFSIYTCWESH